MKHVHSMAGFMSSPGHQLCVLKEVQPTCFSGKIRSGSVAAFSRLDDQGKGSNTTRFRVEALAVLQGDVGDESHNMAWGDRQVEFELLGYVDHLLLWRY
jgi:hypothetical protein